MPAVPSSALPWTTYRDVRLRALATNPEAFGSSIERETAFPVAQWIERATTPGTFVWFAEGDPVTQGTETPRGDGLIGLFSAVHYLDHPEASEVSDVFGADAAHLAFITQMWVDPAHRGSGAFDELMDAAVARARGIDLRAIALHVYGSNTRAGAAYRHYGFRATERSPECPADEDEYVLPLT